MNIETWFAFVVAASVVLIIPGPTIILVLGHSLAHGRRATLPLVAGVALGDFTAMTFSLVGLGAVMATSASLFTLFKWVGALYLIYMGISMWRAKVSATEISTERAERSAGSLFAHAYVVTALNPKSVVFFVAFLPQFIRPGQSGSTQLVILGASFLVLATVNATLYAVFAGRIREAVRTPRARRLFNRAGGSALVGAGLITASVQRSQ